MFNQNFAKGGLNQQLEYLCLKIILFEQSAEQIGATQACRKRTFGGEAQSRWAIFVLEQKNSYLSAIWIAFRTIVGPFESANCSI